MSQEKDKELDDLFKKKFEDPVDHIGYREEDWNALEPMLDKHKKRKNIVFWLPILSSAAALLLIFFGWLLFRGNITPHHHKNNLQAANHRQRVNTGTNKRAKGKPAEPKQKTPLYVNNTGNLKTGKSSHGKSYFAVSTVGARRIESVHQTDAINTTVAAKNITNEPLMAKSLQPLFSTAPITAPGINLADLLKVSPNTLTGANSPKNEKIKIKARNTGFRPQYAISVLAAPDENSVGSFQQAQLGANVGLMFSGEILKKFTISTGALYSEMPYLTPFSDYHTNYQFSTAPENVLADCRMLDIPINLGYQVFSKQQNKIIIGTGLSSYIMLHQSYTFNYAYDATGGPASFTVPNNGKYFFGVLNLNATFERRLNSRVGIDVQPYMKIPLTNLGYSQVRLQSTGVAVALHWNLGSMSKP